MQKEELDSKIKELLKEGSGKKYKVKRRRLGKTGLQVSEIGLGGHEWGLDGKAAGGEEYQKEKLEVMRKALELGVNYFDNTNPYEGGWLGKRIKELNAKDKIIVAYGESDDYVKNADEAHIRKLVENQLKILGLEKLDIFMIFDFAIIDYEKNNKISVKEELEKVSRVLEKIKKEGKIRFSCLGSHCFGFRFPEYTEDADIGSLFDTIQINFNFLDNGPLNDIIPYANKNDMGVVVMTPFRKGTLLNKYYGGSHPRDKDLKKPDDPIFEKLKGREAGLDWALLKYVVDVEGVSTVIPGVANREQLVRDLAASIFREG